MCVSMYILVLQVFVMNAVYRDIRCSSVLHNGNTDVRCVFSSVLSCE